MHMDSGVLSAVGGQQQETAPESRAEELQIIEDLVEQGGHSLHCSIDTSWWREWSRWTGYGGESSTSGVRPGPIDNSRLLSSSGASVSCKLVCEGVWKQLESWYGGGPRVAVTPEQVPKQLSCIFYVLGTRRKAWHTEMEAQVSALTALVRVCAHFNLRHENHYLYSPATGKSIPIDGDVELGDLGLQQETKLCLLPKVAEMDSLSSCYLGRVGLENQGNTCYMNSALQVILHCPEIMKYFLLDMYRDHISRNNPEGSKGKIVEAFADLAKKIWRVGGTGTSSYSAHTRPSRFWDAFSRQYIQFASKAQHDTAEFAEGVLDGLMEDCNRSAIPKVFKVMDDDPSKSDEEMANDNWDYHMCRSDSFITDKFHGQYRAVTTCPSCSFSSRKFESFTILQLGLPQPKTREVNFLLIDVGGNSAPRNMKVDVPGEGTVKDMYYVVANFLGENDPEPWTVMALGQKRGEGEVAIKSPDEKLSNFLGFGALVVYCYPSRELGPHSGGVETHFIHQKQAVYTTHFPWPGHQIREKQRFGFPLVVWIPDISMVDHIRGRSPRKRPHGILEEIFEASLRPAKRKKEDVICLGFHGVTDDPVEDQAYESGGESKSSRAMGEAWGSSMYGMQIKGENLPNSSGCGALSEAHNVKDGYWPVHSGGICRGSEEVANLPPVQGSGATAAAGETNMYGGLNGEDSEAQALEERNIGIEKLTPHYTTLMSKEHEDAQCRNEPMDELSDKGNGSIIYGQRPESCLESHQCQTCTNQHIYCEDDAMDTSPTEINHVDGPGNPGDCSNSDGQVRGGHTVPCSERHADMGIKRDSLWGVDLEIGASATEDLREKPDVIDCCEEASDHRYSKVDLEVLGTSQPPTDMINSNENFREAINESPSAGLEVTGSPENPSKEGSLLPLAPIKENGLEASEAGAHHIISEKSAVEHTNLVGTQPPSPEISDGTTDAIGGDDVDSVAAQEGDGSGSDYDIGLGPLVGDEEPTNYPVTYQTYTSHGRSAPTMKHICSSQEGSYDLMEIDDDGDVHDSNPWTRSRKIIVDWTSIGEDIYNLEMLQETVVDYHTTQKNEVHTILECFEHDFSPHPLDKNNLWECGQCKKRVEGIKSMRLWKTPDVLLISLKRFNFSGYRSIKLTPKVQFPLYGLDLSEFCESHESGNPMIYDLYGVCYHHGDNPKSGHYTSVVKMPDGEWCKFNDSMVYVANEEHDIITSNAYLLCYRRRSACVLNPADILGEVLLHEDREQRRRADEQYRDGKLTEIEEYGNGSVHSNRYGGTPQYGLGKFAEWNSLSDENYTNTWESNSHRTTSDGWGALDAPHKGSLSCTNWSKNENGSNSLSSCQVKSPDYPSDELIVNGTNQPHPQSDPGETPG